MIIPRKIGLAIIIIFAGLVAVGGAFFTYYFWTYGAAQQKPGLVVPPEDIGYPE